MVHLKTSFTTIYFVDILTDYDLISVKTLSTQPLRKYEVVDEKK